MIAQQHELRSWFRDEFRKSGYTQVQFARSFRVSRATQGV